MPKVFRINTKERTVTEEGFKKEYQLFGNRGLTAKFLNDEVNPKCDPLGKDNKLVICTSLFGGTPVSTAYRCSFGAKSPLTGGIKECNVGGNLGYYLVGQDIKMMIFEELPEDGKWYYVKVSADGKVELLPADEYAGLNTYAFVEKMHEKYGDNIGVAAIGTPGERQYNVAAVMATDHQTGQPCRAAGRGGLGAVMGAKKIKGIVIEKANFKTEVKYADKERFDAAVKRFINAVMNDESAKGLHEGGTHGIIGLTKSLNIMPVKNFSGEMADDEKFKKIDVEALDKAIKKNGGKHGMACQPGCLVRCSNVYNDENGNYLTSSLEYETTVMCGPNLDIYDIEFLARIDRVLDDLGVDSIEVGNALAVCMDAGKIPWGDQDAVFALVEELNQGTGFGSILGQGTEAVGKALGAKRVPTVKGQGLAAYDPRTMKGQGVTYSLTAMGADHTTGNTVEAQDVDHADKEGKIELAVQMQAGTAAADNIGCIFCVTKALGPDMLPEMFAGLFGGEWDMDKVIGLGIQTLLLEKQFNQAAGFTAEDNKLPEFFSTEKTANGSVWDITQEELSKVDLF